MLGVLLEMVMGLMIRYSLLVLVIIIIGVIYPVAFMLWLTACVTPGRTAVRLACIWTFYLKLDTGLLVLVL